MAIQLKSLKVFCDVVRQRSFSRAADANQISQSGASQLVQQLEEGLGVKLIDRSKRPFVLTPEGEVYYEGCRGVVERYFAVEDRVRTLHQEVAGHVRVASIYSVGLHHMNRHLQDFLSQHPKANVRLEYLHPHRVYQSVEDDLADLGLVSYPKSSRTVTAIAWREEPMVLVTSPGHPLANRTRVGLDELNGQTMVGFDADLTIRREIDRVLDLHGAEVRVVMEFDNIETIKRAIEIDAGVALLPEPTVVREVQSGTLAAVPLDTDELVRPLGIIHRRGKELSSTAQRFIELLQREGHAAQPADRNTAQPADRNTAPAANGHAAQPVPSPETANGATNRNGNASVPPAPRRDGGSGRPPADRRGGKMEIQPAERRDHDTEPPPAKRRRRVLGNPR
ncbi:MAG TPA: LysR substrate-binding domain-containing protein [Pirellulales bacterium]|nr:LysR substrate-binding domain-containing protein [Pirellulales bacterium]